MIYVKAMMNDDLIIIILKAMRRGSSERSLFTFK